IERGPVGLIGHAKGDALEAAARLAAPPRAAEPDLEALIRLPHARGVPFTTWEGAAAAGTVRGGAGTRPGAPADRGPLPGGDAPDPPDPGPAGDAPSSRFAPRGRHDGLVSAWLVW